MKKPKNLTLGVDTVFERITAIGHELYPIILEKAISDISFSREFISHIYGGNTQQTFPQIKRERLASHGLNDFMFPNLSFNPHAPQLPGSPGLFFTTGDSDNPGEWPTVQRVISRIKSGEWLYVGQYKLAPVAPLTKEEWATQDNGVCISPS